LLLGVQRGAFIWGVPNVPKKIGDKRINMALSNKKKEKKPKLGEPPFTISPSLIQTFSLLDLQVPNGNIGYCCMLVVVPKGDIGYCHMLVGECLA
jgi:hypothetical protein